MATGVLFQRLCDDVDVCLALDHFGPNGGWNEKKSGKGNAEPGQTNPVDGRKFCDQQINSSGQ